MTDDFDFYQQENSVTAELMALEAKRLLDAGKKALERKPLPGIACPQCKGLGDVCINVEKPLLHPYRFQKCPTCGGSGRAEFIPRALAQIEVEAPPSEHLDRVFLNAPWHIHQSWGDIDHRVVVDRKGNFVGRFKNEDVALLIVELVNRIPVSQATDTFTPEDSD